MKKGLVIFSVLILCAFASQAQRHIKGVQAFEVTGGVTGKGLYGSIGYSKYLLSNFYLKGNVLYEGGKIDSRSYSTAYFDVTPAFTFAKIKQNVFFNVVGGFSAAYENASGEGNAPTQSGFIYGGLIGGELEIAVSDNVMLLINGNQRFYANSTIGSQRYFVGGGIKFCF